MQTKFFITNLTSAIVQAVQIWQKILFLALGLKALNMSTIVMPGVEKFVDQCMNMNDKFKKAGSLFAY